MQTCRTTHSLEKLARNSLKPAAGCKVEGRVAVERRLVDVDAVLEQLGDDRRCAQPHRLVQRAQAGLVEHVAVCAPVQQRLDHHAVAAVGDGKVQRRVVVQVLCIDIGALRQARGQHCG
jgi:hypothetical protein